MCASGFDFLDVGKHFFVQRVLRRQTEHQRSRLHQGDGAVLEFSGRDREGIDIGDLLQLQRAFVGDGGVQSSADKKYLVSGVKNLCQRFNLAHVSQIGRQLARNLAQRRKQRVVVRLTDCAEGSAHVQREQIHAGQLGRVSLGGSDRDLRPCPGVEHIIGFSGDGAADDIDHAEHSRALCLGRAQGCQRIQGFS